MQATFGIAVEALLSGDVDAVLMDETAGQCYVGVNADELKVVGKSLSSDELGFIFPLDSDLVGPVNFALAQMVSSGFMDDLAEKYFSDQFAITYDDICQGAYAGEDDECCAASSLTTCKDAGFLPGVFAYVAIDTNPNGALP